MFKKMLKVFLSTTPPLFRHIPYSDKLLFMNIFRTSDNKIVIAQKPNSSLVLWFIVVVGSKLTNNQKLNNLLGISASIVLIYWAILELLSGVNTWRRILGLVVLLISLKSLFL